MKLFLDGRLKAFDNLLKLLGISVIYDGIFWWGYRMEREACRQMVVGGAMNLWGWANFTACRSRWVSLGSGYMGLLGT